MLRVTLWHEPGGFQFFLRDPNEKELRRSSEAVVNEMRAKAFSARRGGVAVRTISEFSSIAVKVEYDAGGFDDEALDGWDHVVECALETTSGKFVFEGCTDPEPFGMLDVPKGMYRVRIHFGGQQSGKVDGSSEDFYLIRIWPGRDGATRFLKGKEMWPRPEQHWERDRRLSRRYPPRTGGGDMSFQRLS